MTLRFETEAKRIGSTPFEREVSGRLRRRRKRVLPRSSAIPPGNPVSEEIPESGKEKRGQKIPDSPPSGAGKRFPAREIAELLGQNRKSRAAERIAEGISGEEIVFFRAEAVSALR